MPEQLIDLRSDTVTKPTAGMLEFMMSAKVGDDVFGEDPTVSLLEEKAAKMFGMEAALFCPSGTMTNQIAIRLHTQPQDEVICDKLSHIYLYEGGGVAYNSLASVRLLDGDRGRITAEQVKENINNPEDIHFARTALVSLENTMNKGGGCYYSLAEIARIHAVCKEHGLALHLDGARLFNALAATGEDPQEYGKYFDTISICLSKGLGAPVGSLLLGSKDQIKKARRFRKVMGGGMRQAGFLAAAGIYALEHHVGRLKEDHEKARVLAATLEKQNYVGSVMPVETNIVIFTLAQGLEPKSFLETLAAAGIRAVAFGKREIRLVTHLDFTNEQLEQAVEIFEQLKVSVVA
jgi:threonine aldolase